MISPLEWLITANRRNPQCHGVTPWFSGLTKPERVGYYERHFTDSPSIGMASMQYWDGEVWRASPDSKPHWRQVGDYPAWRGLTAAQAKLNGQRD